MRIIISSQRGDFNIRMAAETISNQNTTVLDGEHAAQILSAKQKDGSLHIGFVEQQLQHQQGI
jgi:hypothetical protein